MTGKNINMASKFSFVAVAAVGIALAGGVAWWLQSRPQLPNTIQGAEGSVARPAGGAPGAPRVVGVEVARVAVQSLRDDAQSVGSLRARNSVMLRPELVGRITALNFKDGGPVRQGQLLVQFDDQLQQAEVQQMQAQLAIAQANYQRTQELVAEKFLAQQTLDTSAANLKVAQAQLALARARLARMAVRAPFAGTAGIRLVNVGDYVKDGADLVALEDARQMLVDYRLPERYGGRVKPGQSVELTLDALPGRSFKAAVEAIDPLLDTTGRVCGRARLAGGARACALAHRHVGSSDHGVLNQRGGAGGAGRSACAARRQAVCHPAGRAAGRNHAACRQPICLAASRGQAGRAPRRSG